MPTESPNEFDFSTSSLVALAAERNVVGTILLDPRRLDEIREHVQPEHFYSPATSTVLAMCYALRDAYQPVDPVTVAQALGARKQLKDAGGVAGISSLMEEVGTVANAVYYAEQVKFAHSRRELFEVGAQIRELAIGSGSTPEILAEAERAVYSVSDTTQGRRDVKDLLEHANDVLEHLDMVLRGGHSGLVVGFPDLDRVLLGLRPGHMNLLGGRTSLGKSALALNMANNVSKDGHSVAYFSLEMTGLELVTRLVAMESGVPAQKITGGYVTAIDQTMLANTVAGFAGRKLVVDESPRLTMAQIASTARRMKRSADGLDLVVLDYLQLVRPDERHNSREQEVAEISASIKGLARELEIPILALTQLRRKQDNSKPELSDLRESGAQEQDADVVILLHQDKEQEQLHDARLLEVLVKKNRNGPTGETKLLFRRNIQHFVSAAKTASGNFWSREPGEDDESF